MEERRWLLAEMHCHSSNSPDGELAPEELVAIYEDNSYDILAITDHNVFTRVQSEKMIIIPAYELSAAFAKPFFYGHILIYFLKRAPLSLDEALSQGALICLAHPFVWPWWKKKVPSQVEGYEMFNTRLYRKWRPIGRIANWLSCIWYGMFYKIRVAGSDAHTRDEFAKIRFWIYARRDLEDIKGAILQGRVRIEY